MEDKNPSAPRIKNSLKSTASLDEKAALYALMHVINDGIIITDSQNHIKLLNEQAVEITGFKKDEAVGKPFSTVFKVLHRSPLNDERISGDVIVLKTKQTVYRNVIASSSPIYDINGGPAGSITVFHDIKARNLIHEVAAYLSLFDSLTNLHNRAFFEHEVSFLELSGNLPIAFIMGDINGLKLTNDVFGHESGDILIKETADIIKKLARPQDITARWGGDEFVICMPGAGLNEAKDRCARMEELSHMKKIPWGNGKIHLNISFGYALKNTKGQTFQQVLREAEAMMYHKKLSQSKNTQGEVVEYIEKKLSQRDPSFEEHSAKAALYMNELGRRCSCTIIERQRMQLLARYYDIGIIAIDEAILNKKEPLTENEKIQLKSHVEIGYHIALTVPELAPIAGYILAHHERWDGTGYPHGLSNDDIPFPSRAIAIVDAYMNLTRNQAMSQEEAIEEMKKNIGTRFPKRLTEVMIDTLIRERTETLPFYVKGKTPDTVSSSLSESIFEPLPLKK